MPDSAAKGSFGFTSCSKRERIVAADYPLACKMPDVLSLISANRHPNAAFSRCGNHTEGAVTPIFWPDPTGVHKKMARGASADHLLKSILSVFEMPGDSQTP